MPKRIAKYYFKSLDLRCPPTFLEQIGNLARMHSANAVTYSFDFDRDLDWNSGEYGDGGSCYWHSNARARDMLRDNGGFAIRFYRSNDEGMGRAWIVDVDGFYVLFNGYGFTSDSTLTIVRIFAEFMGLSYEKIQLTNNDSTTGTLYINGGRGYIVGTPENLTGVTNYDFDWEAPEETYSCDDCGDEISEDDLYLSPNGASYCHDCFYERYDTCYDCGETWHRDDLTYVESADRDVCESCLDRRYDTCKVCDEWFPKGDLINGHCEGCKPDEPEPETDQDAA